MKFSMKKAHSRSVSNMGKLVRIIAQTRYLPIVSW